MSTGLDTKLRRLRLAFMAASFEAQNAESLRDKHSYLEFLTELADGDDTIAGDADVARVPRRAGAVDNAAAGDEDVEGGISSASCISRGRCRGRRWCRRLTRAQQSGDARDEK